MQVWPPTLRGPPKLRAKFPQTHPTLSPKPSGSALINEDLTTHVLIVACDEF